LPGKVIAGFYSVTEAKVEGRKDRLMIVGFGVNGRNVARAAQLSGIPYAVIEMNPETVRGEHA
jgi:CPA2 family monovalent cation:H+ antiporter-2